MKKTNRWLYAIVGCAVLLVSGLVYAWSGLSGPIAAEFPQWSAAQLSLTFTIVMSFFCVGSLVGGLLSSKVSQKVYLWVSAALFLTGFLLTANVRSILMLYIGFGVICGFASGLSYNAVLGTVGKWFPDKAGLVSGILLMGFGLSSFLVGKLYQTFTPDTVGAWRHSFVVLGIIAAVIMAVGGFLLEKPDADFVPPATAQNRKKYVNPVAEEADTATMMKRPSLWLLYLWSVLLSAVGLVLVSQASGIAREIGTGVSAGTIATVVGLISIFNGIGRVIFGGMSYGGVTPANSAFVSSYYSMKHYSMNLSVVVTNLLFASFGSTIAGVLYDATKSYFSVYLMIAGLAAVGILVSAAISLCDKRALARWTTGEKVET